MVAAQQFPEKQHWHSMATYTGDTIECDLTSTMGGSPVPRDAVEGVVANVSAAVVSGRYSGALDAWAGPAIWS